MHSFARTCVAAGVLCALPAIVAAQGAVSLSDGRWELQGAATAIDTVAGRVSLRVETGEALRKDVRLENGTIDADVFMTNRRSFVYVNFRVQGPGEQEEFYIRPHKSNLPDAIQYAPSYQGQSAWQLYHGAAGAVSADIQHGAWTHVRVVISGRRAALFLGDTVTPALVVPRLSREPRPGYISLRGFLPAGTPGTGPIARFANVQVRPNVIAYDFGPPPPALAPLPGLITEWIVGDAFAAPDTILSSIEPAWLAHPKRAVALANGLVELNRVVTMPKITRYDGGVARVTINADQAGMRRLNLGFSDVATVFLNGRPIFNRDDSYDYANRRDGLIGLDQASVFLPLQAGRNELAVLVTDRFGGWGLMGQIPDTRGIRVEP